ncbi:hypothetical protein L345_01103, partial [Ophiophagus hannah]
MALGRWKKQDTRSHFRSEKLFPAPRLGFLALASRDQVDGRPLAPDLATLQERDFCSDLEQPQVQRSRAAIGFGAGTAALLFLDGKNCFSESTLRMLNSSINKSWKLHK